MATGAISSAGVPDAGRVTADGILVGKPITDGGVQTTWSSNAKMRDMGDAGKMRCYQAVQVDAMMVCEGDYVYLTPRKKGQPMEMAIVEGMYFAGGNKLCCVRWLWRAQTLKHKVQDVHTREIFLSDCYGEWFVEGIEGCADSALNNTPT